MDVRALNQHLNKNKKASLYIVSGEDLYLKSEAESLIKDCYQRGFQEAGVEVDIEVYTAPQMDYDRCLDALQTISFFSSEKFIQIRNAEKANVKFLENLSQFFEKENLSGVTLVLSFTKIDKRKKAIKSLFSNAVQVEAKAPYDNQIETWIKYIAAKEKLSLNQEALSSLSFLAGPSLSEIAKSVKKLKDIFGKDPVGRLEVQEFISKSGEEDIFKICDFLGNGDITKAMLGLEYAIKHGSSSIGALSLFHRHFKIIEGILSEQEKVRAGGSRLAQKDLALKVGVPPYFFNNYASQTRSWSLPKMKQVFRALEATDQSLKSTSLKESTIFAGFFMELSRILGERRGLMSLSESMASRV